MNKEEERLGEVFMITITLSMTTFDIQEIRSQEGSPDRGLNSPTKHLPDTSNNANVKEELNDN